MSVTVSASGSEYVRVPLAASIPGQAVDPTGDSVYLAFQSTDTPVSATWNAGTWEGPFGGVYYVRVLVGSGGVALSAGTYYVWVKVVDNPETIYRSCGQVVVTA